jgi:DNA-binding MarR family transcriptional regulator
MEKKGWVRREACPQDRRGSWAVLTPEGRATIEAVAPVHVDGVRRWFFDLVAPDQLRVLGEVFGRVDDRLRDDLGSTCTEGDDSRSD